MQHAYSPSFTTAHQHTVSAITAAGKKLSEAQQSILTRRKINLDIAQKLGWNTCAEDGKWLEIPYYRDGKLVNFKRRTLEKSDKKFYQMEGGEKCVYNVDMLEEITANDVLVITEGEMDCIVALHLGWKAVSIPDGAPATQVADMDAKKYAYLADIPDKITIILAVDDDIAGHNLLHDLSVRLGKARCKFLRYPQGCKDLNEVLYHHGEDYCQLMLQQAEYMAVSGVRRLSELPPAPQATPYSNGINGINDRFFLRMGDFSVVTGYANHGKSTFTNELMVNMAMLHKWNIAVASFEQSPTTDHRRALHTLHGGMLQKHMTDAQKQEAEQFIENYFCFIVPPEFEGGKDTDTLDLSWLLEKMTTAVLRFGVNMIIIDPWNELEHAIPYGMTETQYIRHAIMMLKQFARKYNVHVMIVAHPAKPQVFKGEVPDVSLYSIADSAHWANKADLGFVIKRRKDKKTILCVAKSRYAEILGEVAEYEMDYVYERGRLIYSPDPEEEIEETVKNYKRKKS